MIDDAPLDYATPRGHLLAPRANWLAVFAFVWTFAVVLPVGVVLLYGWREFRAALPPTVFVPLGVAGLVVVPAVALVCAFVATERGAAWDSGYRWTGFAVWAAPFASLMTSAGVMFWFRELLVLPI
jgi:hypothetical protein